MISLATLLTVAIVVSATSVPVDSEAEVAACSPPQDHLLIAARYIEAADALALHEHGYWHVLLHFRRGLLGRRSLIDDPKFFLSPNGKHDPQAELHETLRAMLSPVAEGEEGLKAHAGYRFPARQTWLVEQLQIPETELGMPRCEELHLILERIRPQAVSLVYPAAYMNSPASLFGHTLLTIRSEHQSELLNHAINYAAVTEETNGVVFAIKGIFGRYPGRLSVMPYHRKVRDYNDISQRDIWEYPLDFTPEEVHRMMLHVWEFSHVYAKYYFFDENCSFNLLYLLEAGRPGLQLIDNTRPWVIPLDTVRVVDDAGIVDGVIYRPSKATVVRNIASQLNPADRQLARQLATGEQTPIEVFAAPHNSSTREIARRALVLDLAVEGLSSQHGRQLILRDQYAPRFRELLVARSQLDPPADYITEPAKPGRPDKGHGSSRFTIGGGIDHGDGFLEASIRPAYHDLLDPSTGYLNGSEIQFLGITGRWYEGDELPELHRFDALTIFSISPRDEFFSPVSWKILTGVERERVEDGDYRHHAFLNTGGGYAWQLTPANLVYSMLEVELRLGSMDHDHAAGAGASLGWLATLHHDYKLHAFVRGIRYGIGDSYTYMEAVLSQRYAFHENLAILLDLSAKEIHNRTYTESSLRLAFYF